ncbi:meprin A subunit beta-like [Carcharodon carcharias]|uniref:meprin A subunit beta-like n=1 Tax=Carcharodon carcharias TaxID=13397 RepID=UPI001B7E9096|nr:meprin A subunit beta-like [Carcharodon carcharias]
MGSAHAALRCEATVELDRLDSGEAADYECPICLQALERPIETRCGHIFCQACHERNFNINNKKCPLCRKTTSYMEQYATDIEKQMMIKKASCRGCDIQVCLINMRDHTKTCSRYLEEYGSASDAETLPPPTPASHRSAEAYKLQAPGNPPFLLALVQMRKWRAQSQEEQRPEQLEAAEPQESQDAGDQGQNTVDWMQAALRALWASYILAKKVLLNAPRESCSLRSFHTKTTLGHPAAIKSTEEGQTVGLDDPPQLTAGRTLAYEDTWEHTKEGQNFNRYIYFAEIREHELGSSCFKKFNGCLSSQPTSREIEVDVDNGLDQDIFEINEDLGLNLVEGDMRIDKKIDRSSIIGAKYRWPKTIPYYLEDNLDVNAKGIILKAFEQYRLKSCIDFKPWTGEGNYISIFKGSGCWSSVGKQHEGRQELSIGKGCERIGTIEHEFLHALGFWHEQSRADRDDYITIVWDRIENGKEYNFNKYNDKKSSDLNIPYDYTSVMHYSSTAFNNGTKPTIVTKIEEFSDVIGQRLDFSDYDVLRLNRLYNCSSSLSFMDRCSFELESICGMIQGLGNNAVWERVTQVSAGPDQDHTNMGNCAGIGYFMYFSTSTGLAGNNTLLESRIYYPKRGFQCLEFYSFNSGSENDELNIWVRVYNETNTNGILTKIIGMKGAGLNYWQLHHVSLAISDKFRVVFEGVKGTGSSTGGISIDDINLSETHCPTHVWHIKNFTHLLKTSPSGKAGKIYSPRYYSSDGYAFQIAVYVNGTSRRPFYLAVFFHLVSGVNDTNLQWPCPWKQGTMLLMDQHPDIRRRMSHQRSVTTDPSEGNQTFHIWDRPDLVGDLVTESDGTSYYRGPGKGTMVFLSHERLKSREFIKGDGAYFLLTMEAAEVRSGNLPPDEPIEVLSAKPTASATEGSTTEPSAEIPGLCSDLQCQNEGICVVDNGEPVCRCTTGTDWWYSGKYCETHSKQEDTVVIAVASSISVFLVMLIITLLSVYCLRRKYQKVGKNDGEQGMGVINEAVASDLTVIGFAIEGSTPH